MSAKKVEAIVDLSDDEIEKITEFAHARLRTEMWLGSRDPHTQVVLHYLDNKPVATEITWVPALFTAFREILDNAIDELITHRRGDRVDISFDAKNMIFTVKDNGRGIPITFKETHQQYAATLAMTETKAGRNFKDATRGATRGLNGVGGSIVNFCSEWLQMDIFRDGKHFSQRFHEGEIGSTDLVIEDPIILPVNDKLKNETGTTIKLKLSPRVFKVMKLPEDFVRSRVMDVALCYPNLKVFYNGQRIQLAKGGVEKTLFANSNPIFVEFNDIGFHSRFWLIPEFFKQEDQIVEFNHSLVNAIPTLNGGIHVDTFRRIFISGMLTALEPTSKRKKLKPNRGDISDGMLLFNITEMDQPSFDSQSKTRLINEGVGSIIKKTLEDPSFFKNIIKKYPEWVENIYKRCAERTKKNDDKEASSLAKKRSKVEDLEDACGVDRSKCILFLGEGKSAISGMVEARDPNIHGGLPLRGKVLNVHGEKSIDIMKNDALRKIMMAIGLSVGERVNRHKLRYGKVYITTDADEDGKNIAALLVNFFYTLWPELFDPDKPAFIYLFDTPLIIAVKGKQRKYWYNENYHEFSGDEHKGWEITRAKGLAALKRDDWRWVLANPKATGLVNDGHLLKALDLLFNPKLADDRKTWIGM